MEKGDAIISIQYHPEASPGPHDTDGLCDGLCKIIIDNTK
ncbi:MAG: glutamine amidotransferase-related protein [Verrucomicrobiia bacterium]